MPRSAILSTIALGAVAAGVAVGASASAQGPAGRTIVFRELEKGATFTHIRNTKGAPAGGMAQGDAITFTNPVTQGGKPAGRLYADCVTSVGARNFRKGTLTCSVVVVLKDGTLTLQANSSPGVPKTTGAVTGAYAGADGTFVSRAGRDIVILTG